MLKRLSGRTKEVAAFLLVLIYCVLLLSLNPGPWEMLSVIVLSLMAVAVILVFSPDERDDEADHEQAGLSPDDAFKSGTYRAASRVGREQAPTDDVAGPSQYAPGAEPPSESDGRTE